MKRVLQLILKSVFVFIILTGLYFFCAYSFSRMCVEKEQTNESEVTAYILSNGIHTDIVVPIKSVIFNWNEIIKSENTLSKDSTASLIAFGWGDKGFYLETPTWEDLKFKTAFNAAIGLSSSAIHTTYYKNLKESDRCKKIQLNKNQYLRLTEYIKQSFSLNENKNTIHISTNAVYGKHDAFYEAKGNYNLFKTCNTWANNALKACGQKACFWTPFESGIFYHYK